MNKRLQQLRITSSWVGAVALAAIATLPAGAAELTRQRVPQPEGDRGVLQLAQAAGVCRQVGVEGGLYVREAPDVYSEAIGALETGVQMTVTALEPASWVPIVEPIEGYVFSSLFVPCQAGEPVSTGTGVCRQVAAEGGLYVRKAPDVYSEAIGAIETGGTVTVQALEPASWVPVSEPVAGYMFSSYLVPCS